jgi:hypothetical protein
MAKLSQNSTSQPLYQSSPIEEEQDLILDDDFKLELFNTILFNFNFQIQLL